MNQPLFPKSTSPCDYRVWSVTVWPGNTVHYTLAAVIGKLHIMVISRIPTGLPPSFQFCRKQLQWWRVILTKSRGTEPCLAANQFCLFQHSTWKAKHIKRPTHTHAACLKAHVNTHTRDRQVSVNQKLEHLVYLSAGASSPRQMKAVSELSGQGLIWFFLGNYGEVMAVFRDGWLFCQSPLKGAI